MTYYNFATPSAIDKLLLENRSYLGLNNNVYLFPKNKVGALNTDGSVVLADCTNPAKQNIAGICFEDIISGEKGYFLQLETATDALVGLGAQAGDSIYLAVVAGDMTTTAPSGPGEAVIRLGVAEANPVSGLITDLRIDLTPVSTGGGGVTAPQVQQIVDANRDTQGENLSGINIQAFKAIAWENAGTIVAGDATIAARCDVIGLSIVAIANNAFGTVRTEGIVPGAVASLGAQAGQEVFLAEGAGGNLTLTAPTVVTSGIIKVGVAVPPTGSTGAATDLLIQIDRIATP
jgi:hypothetical protein